MNILTGFFLIGLSLIWSYRSFKERNKHETFGFLINLNSIVVGLGLFIIGILLITGKVLFF
jgi:hypothetical protein